MIRAHVPRCLPIYLERHLEWEIWGMPDRILTGRQSWHQVLFAFGVKPTLMETDPGPLDAGVP